MTGPPGPVIPCTTLRAWPLAVSGGWPARCSPRLRSEDGRPRAQGGQPFTPEMLTLGSPRRVRSGAIPSRPMTSAPSPQPRSTRELAAADLRRLPPHRNLHPAVGRREQRVLRQVPVRVGSGPAAGHRRGLPPARAERDRRAGRARARRHPARHDDVAAERPPDPLRAQAGQDLRHLPARRGRRARRASGSASSKTS